MILIFAQQITKYSKFRIGNLGPDREEIQLRNKKKNASILEKNKLECEKYRGFYFCIAKN